MTNPETEVPERRVGSVVAAIAILRHLDQSRRGEGVNAIARALSLSPSSCFNLLKTLADERFVDFEPMSKLYTLGSGASSLSRHALDPLRAFELGRSRLEQLADAFDITVGMWRRRRHDQMMLIGFVESIANTRIHLTIGQRVPDAAGASGRCAMANSDLEPAEILRRRATVTWADPPDPDSYLAEVYATRLRGWAIDDQRYMKGVTTLAAPVLVRNGRLELCATATMFAGQHQTPRQHDITAQLVEISQWIAVRLREHGE